VNLGPKHQYRITERVDYTTVPPSVAPSEFRPVYASCNQPRPTESLYSSRTPTPITHMHVFIFKPREHYIPSFQRALTS